MRGFLVSVCVLGVSVILTGCAGINRDTPITLSKARAATQGFSPKPNDLETDKNLLKESYYEKVWNYLYVQTQGKTAAEQLAILEPWLMCKSYRYDTMPEKLFLADILSWANLLHVQLGDKDLSSLACFTATVMLHSCYSDASARFADAWLVSLKGFTVNNMYARQNELQRQERILEETTSNIRDGRRLLLSAAYDSYRQINVLDTISHEAAPSENLTETHNGDILDIQRMARPDRSSRFYAAYMRLLLGAGDKLSHAWPVLEAVSIFPNKDALNKVAAMSDFADAYLIWFLYINKYKTESVALANSWLDNPKTASWKKARALIILGALKQPMVGSIVLDNLDLEKQDFTKSYYHLRCVSTDTQKDKEAHKAKIIEAVTKAKHAALPLYLGIRGEDTTPEPLIEMLRKEIANKKYNNGGVSSLYISIIEKAPAGTQDELVDLMYKAYNPEWRQIANTIYKQRLPDKLSKSYVIDVLEGSSPWKKVALVKFLATANPQYRPFIAKFLRGEYYTKADRQWIRSHLKNMYTKDITANYSINWSVVNREVAKSEARIRSLLTLGAIEAINVLDDSEARSLIESRFLTDDILCAGGANWIITATSGDGSNWSPPANIKATTDIQKAVLAFLSAHFSTEKNYSKYVRLLAGQRKNPCWPSAAALGKFYVSKEMHAIPASDQKHYNPVDTVCMEGIVNNIRNRCSQFGID